jgi:hypothetical protein
MNDFASTVQSVNRGPKSILPFKLVHHDINYSLQQLKKTKIEVTWPRREELCTKNLSGNIENSNRSGVLRRWSSHHFLWKSENLTSFISHHYLYSMSVFGKSPKGSEPGSADNYNVCLST